VYTTYCNTVQSAMLNKVVAELYLSHLIIFDG
jgi:hypothetical protein